VLEDVPGAPPDIPFVIAPPDESARVPVVPVVPDDREDGETAPCVPDDEDPVAPEVVDEVPFLASVVLLTGAAGPV